MIFARSHIAAIALITILTVFGHDALMAADPHPAADAAHHEAPVPAEASDCGAIAGVHAKSPSGHGLDDLTVTPSLPQATGESAGFVAHWLVEPNHPPDTRRALLQVYLN